ncbi:MAG: hypothetical protein ABI833_11440 [Acidobacteriota bacterium]
MEPMTGELKETVIRGYPCGLWLVLAGEYPSDVVSAHETLCSAPRAIRVSGA